MQRSTALCPGKRLYLIDLACRISAMESGRVAMNPVAYRLFNRRLRDAMCGYATDVLMAHVGRAHPAVRHVLNQRRFEVSAAFEGFDGIRARLAASALLRRLMR